MAVTPLRCAAQATSEPALQSPSPARDSLRLIEAFRSLSTREQLPLFELIVPEGHSYLFGSSPEADRRSSPPFRVRVRNAAGIKALLSLDELGTAEALINGDVEVDGDFLAALDLRQFFDDRHPLLSIWRFVPPLLSGQVAADKKEIPRHYDVGDEFYFTFLDNDVRLYSQAFYRSETDSLECAARNKLDYIIDSCNLGPGANVLDVGAGWGSFSSYAAARGINVTMLTLAHKQCQRILTDYGGTAPPPESSRLCVKCIYAFAPGRRFDAVVLLGVMEHLPNYDGLCRQFDALLRPGGRVYMDFSAIERSTPAAPPHIATCFPAIIRRSSCMNCWRRPMRAPLRPSPSTTIGTVTF